MNKDDLRKSILKKRKLYPIDLVTKSSKIICEQIIGHEGYKNAKSIMLYISHGGEVLTESIIERALIDGKRVFAPRVRDKTNMDAVMIDGKFIKSAFGISEPAGKIVAAADEIDLFIVPGIAFDTMCNRMGFGRGYYDRFLLGKRGYKIGVAFEFQIVSSVFPRGHDIPMDIVITEKRVFMKR